jgi:hypothetical protein
MISAISAWDDAALVCALQEGSREAFSEIYRRYSKLMFIQTFYRMSSLPCGRKETRYPLINH